MSNWLRKNPLLALSILIMPALLWIGVGSAGTGHGNYIAARVIFPFACLSIGTYVGTSLVVTLLTFAQWPIYGFLADRGSHKFRTIGTIFIVHAAICVWLFTKGSERFR